MLIPKWLRQLCWGRRPLIVGPSRPISRRRTLLLEALECRAAPAVDLVVSKSDGGVSAAPGETITYTIQYDNVGTTDATGVTLTETVGANVTFNLAGSTPGWVDQGNGTFAFIVGPLLAAGPAQQVNFAVTVNSPLPAGVVDTSNSVAIADDGTNGADANTADNIATDATPLNAAPDLTVTKADNGTAVSTGQTIAYAITYQNVGNQNAVGVVLTETLGNDVTFNAQASSPGWVDQGNGTFTLAVGPLAAGAAALQATFAVTVNPTLPAGVSQTANTVTIADDNNNGADPTPLNNTSNDTTTLTAAPDLTVTKTDSNVTGSPGETINYVITYQNVGTQGASGVVLTETLGANVAFNSAASTAGWVDQGGGTFTFPVGTVNAGAAAAQVTFAVTVNNPLANAATQTTNTVAIADDAANGADPTPGNNSVTENTPLNHPPTDITLSNNSVPEGSAVGTVVGTLTRADVDAGDTATFSLLNDAGGRFRIANGNELQVNNSNLDFETATSHLIQVRVTDSDGQTFDEDFTINVTAAADAPNLTVANVSGNEGTGIPLNIQASLNDTDGSETLSVTISGVPTNATLSAGTNNGGGNFSLTAAQLNGLTITSADGNAVFTLTVVATATETSNGQTASTTRTMSVNVQNVAPTATLSSPAVNEGQQAFVSFINQFDPSVPDRSTFQYSYDFNNDGTFEIINSASASAAVPLNLTADGFAVRTIRGRIRDKDGGVNEFITNLEVRNVAPGAVFTGEANIFEGNRVHVTFISHSDPATADRNTWRYSYDFDNNGTFELTDVAGPRAARAAVPLNLTSDGNRLLVVRARIRDKDGTFTQLTVTLDIRNLAPEARFANSGPVQAGGEAVVEFVSPNDPSPQDRGTFLYSYDFNNDGTFDVTDSTASFAAVPANLTASAGSRTIRGRIRDKDGGATTYTTTLVINDAPSDIPTDTGDTDPGDTDPGDTDPFATPTDDFSA